MEIKDKVIIVTGASKGIGRATAERLSKEGACVVLAARDKAALTELEKALPRSFAVPTDVTDERAAQELVEKTIEKFGRIDVLVNGAAQAMAAPVEKIDLSGYRALLELNVIAPLRLMQLVIPKMRTGGGGTILTISSLSTTKYIPFIAGYASTKYALNCLSLTAREELAKDKIVVSVIRPGIADTGFGQNTPWAEPDSLRHAPDGHLLAHVLSPEEIAGKIVDLLHSGDAELNILPKS